MKTKRFLFLFLVLLCILSGTFRPEAKAEFLGDFPTGLLQLEKKAPYYLFVPAEYSPDKGWPLVMIFGERGQDPRKLINGWVDWAKQNQILVLVLPNFFPETGVPYIFDQWVFEVKLEIGMRYRIDPNKILLVGFGSGAHYSSYLALKYPDEFTAAALIRKAWAGPLEKLAKPVSDSKQQPSFYLALDPKGEEFSSLEKKALELEKKGYEIALDRLKSGEDFAKLRDRMLQWFRYQSETRALAKEGAARGWTGAVGRHVRKFFEV